MTVDFSVRYRRVLRLLRCAVLEAARPSARRRKSVLLIGLLAIVVWQQNFAFRAPALDQKFRNTASVGVHHEDRFAYFFFYLGLFPVATTLPNPPLSEAGAMQVVAEHPKTLVQDLTFTWLSGDYGKVFPHLYDAWLKGAPWNLSMTPFNRMYFTLALMILFCSFRLAGRALLGAFLVLLLGSNPFQLYEVHVHNNVHGLSISTALIVLAMHVPMLGYVRRDRRYLWIIPVLTGVFIATIRTIRSEPAPIILAPLVTYFFLSGWSWKRRGGMIALLALSFMSGSHLWSRYFSGKYSEAQTFLAQAGGHPFPGKLRLHHHFWHPVWCGLGDFDQKRNYVWSDFAALKYATPILEKEYNIKVPIYDVVGRYPPDEYFDAAMVYKKLPFHIFEYDEVARRKVLRDIATDPVWYATILGKRLWRILDTTTPVRIAWGGWRRRIPTHGALMVLLAGILVALKARFLLATLLFTLPTCITALFVYSGDGVTYYGIYHIVGTAIAILVFVRVLVLVSRGQRRRIRRDCEKLIENFTRKRTKEGLE